MASFLARFTAAKTQPVPETVPAPAGADARALQAKLTAALSEIERADDPDSELLALYERYREARKETHKVFAGRMSSDAEARLILGRRDAILRDIAKMPARTLRGFGAKMEVLRSCECALLDKACPDKSDAILLQSIVADSHGLFSAEDPIVPEENARSKAEDDTATEARAQRTDRPAMKYRP